MFASAYLPADRLRRLFNVREGQAYVVKLWTASTLSRIEIETGGRLFFSVELPNAEFQRKVLSLL